MRYIIEYQRGNDLTNEQYYSRYYGYEFNTDDDNSAREIVEYFQSECERMQENASIELDANDPDLISGLYRIDENGNYIHIDPIY